MYDGSVVWVPSCRLSVSRAAWPFAQSNAAAIADHWERRCAANPGFFNGVVHVMMEADGRAVRDGQPMAATLIETDFKSFLYWRETGFPAAGVLDAFGSSILRSVEGHVLLGLQSAGNINAGFAYLPGGFIDGRDVDPAGCVDIADSISRELAEETRLGLGDLTLQAGFIVVRTGALIAIAREFCSPLPSAELRAQILSRISREADAELADIVIINSVDDIKTARVLPYTALAIAHVFASTPR